MDDECIKYDEYIKIVINSEGGIKATLKKYRDLVESLNNLPEPSYRLFMYAINRSGDVFREGQTYGDITVLYKAELIIDKTIKEGKKHLKKT